MKTKFILDDFSSAHKIDVDIEVQYDEYDQEVINFPFEINLKEGDRVDIGTDYCIVKWKCVNLVAQCIEYRVEPE
jgi:hypothetical protein